LNAPLNDVILAIGHERRRALPAALAALLGGTLLAFAHDDAFALPSSSRPLGVVPVTTCDDDLSPGSLREVLLQAVDGETVDLTGLTCSAISLGYGALFVTVDDVTIAGNGQSISGAINQNVLTHTGHGLLSMSGVNLGYGRYDGIGGCLYSAGSIDFERGTISDCIASDRGGAIAAKGTLTLRDSIISGNSVAQHQSHMVYGGAAYSVGNMTVIGCEIDGNVATGENAIKYSSYGGALATLGAIDVEQSTFASNTADRGGAVFAAGDDSVIVDSTFSANTATLAGAIFLQGSATLNSDTIAFSIAGPCPDANCYATAVGVVGALEIDNTIIAHNDVDDLETFGTETGAYNLIMTAGEGPPDTIHVDPRLLPLSVNGSLLPAKPKTFALDFDSIAIDAGGGTTSATDERGYPRIIGRAADIGAYEFDDRIFADGFDGT
jgi:hypothetical protein